MGLQYLLLVIVVLATLAYIAGRRKAIAGRRSARLHSLPSYYGAYVAVWTGLPSLILVLLWLLFQGAVLDTLLVGSFPPEMIADRTEAQVALLVSQVKQVAKGIIFGEPSPEIIDAAARYVRWSTIAHWSMVASAIGLALVLLAITRTQIAATFRARQAVERILSVIMIFCSIVAIMTTIGIVVSLVVEAARFFALVPITEFLFGLRWEPQIALRADQVAGLGAFGAVPVFAGTLLISVIAMLIAGPLGLLSAIYLAEYSDRRFRAAVKPILEVLAGIPTVVYGFFAILLVAPALREFGINIGLDVSANSALAAGLVMGIMILPFVSSLSDDAINAVPQAMRDGSTALGATKAETIRGVLIPAALPGIMGGMLLAVSRAIGETMIVVMAAGIIANLTLNPLEAVTTVTVQIVGNLIGDTEFDNPKTLSAFALGLLLFVVTLCLNIVALRIVQKFREKYE